MTIRIIAAIMTIAFILSSPVFALAQDFGDGGFELLEFELDDPFEGDDDGNDEEPFDPDDGEDPDDTDDPDDADGESDADSSASDDEDDAVSDNTSDTADQDNVINDMVEPSMVIYSNEDWYIFDAPSRTIRGLQGEGITANTHNIPAAIGGVPVENIGGSLGTQRPFENNNNVQTVVFPSSVKTIGNLAFRNAKALASVTLNEGLEKIGRQAFEHCVNLKSISIPDSVTLFDQSTQDGHQFRGCTALQTVTIGSGLKRIPGYAFEGCISLKTVNIGTVEEIGQYAFANNRSLATVNFGNCLREIQRHAFQRCITLQTVKLPASMRVIGDYAFTENKALQNLTLNNGLTTIGARAFENNSALRTLTIPNSVTTMPKSSGTSSAFKGCTSLKTITIGTGLTTLPHGMFQGCTALTTINWGKVINIESNAFRDCKSLVTVKLPTTVRTIGNNAFEGNSKLKTLTLNNGLLTIGSMAFYRNTALESVKIPNSVSTLVGSSLGGTFEGCTSLKTVTIGSGLPIIPVRAFSGCKALTTVKLGKIVAIERDAFRNCSKLVNVSFTGNNLVTIGESAFADNTSLVRFVFPSTVVSIGNYAFARSTKLSEAVFTGRSPTTFGRDVFHKAASSFSIFYKKGTAGWTSPTWQGWPTSIAIPGSVPGLKVTPGSGRVTLSWKPASDRNFSITRYEVRQRRANGDWGSWKRVSAKQTSYVFTGLTNGVSYSFQIRAVNSQGSSSVSRAVSTTPKVTKPWAVNNLSATASNGKVALKWTAPHNGGSSITGYQLQQRTGKGSWVTIKTLSASAKSFNVTKLTNGTSYSFRLRAVNKNGNAAWSNTQTAVPMKATK